MVTRCLSVVRWRHPEGRRLISAKTHVVTATVDDQGQHIVKLSEQIR